MLDRLVDGASILCPVMIDYQTESNDKSDPFSDQFIKEIDVGSRDALRHLAGFPACLTTQIPCLHA